VFQKGGLSPPYTIEFNKSESSSTKANAHFEDDTLHVIVSTEPELRRLIGRFVIESKWSRHEWLLMNHVGLYSLTSAIILTTFPAIGFQMSWMILGLRLWILGFTIVSLSLFAFWTGYQVSIRTPKLINKYAVEMVDLGCMTEFDAKDYTPDFHKIAVGGVVICMWGGLVLGIYGMNYYLDASFVFMIPLLLLCLAGVIFLFAGQWKSISLNLCYEDEYETEEEWEEIFEDNEYLQNRFTDLIQRMDFKYTIQSIFDSEYETIKVRFAETKYAQCRAIYDYVEEGILYIDCHDVSEAAAFRYLAAYYVRRSLRFYREVSFNRRSVHIWALLFGLCAPVVAFLTVFVSKEFSIGSLVVASLIFTKLWHMGWKMYEEVRRDLPLALRRTEVFNEYEFAFYNERMFSTSSRSELVFLIAFLLMFVGVGLVIVWLM